MIFVLEINNGQIYEFSKLPFQAWDAGVSRDLEDLISRGIKNSEIMGSISFTIYVWKETENSAFSTIMFRKGENGVWSTQSDRINYFIKESKKSLDK